MTYVVTDACIRCKYMDCVEVCPVDCFYEGDNMLVINPSECIDCGVCEPECPAEAILPTLEEVARNVHGSSRTSEDGFVHVRLRGIEPAAAGTSRPVVLGEAVVDLASGAVTLNP